MSSIIEALFLGNLQPGVHSADETRDALALAIQRVNQYQAELQKQLSSEAGDLLAKYEDAISAQEFICRTENFVEGFCLGLRIGIEAMQDEKRYLSNHK